jgi:hypothetical protein
MTNTDIIFFIALVLLSIIYFYSKYQSVKNEILVVTENSNRQRTKIDEAIIRQKVRLKEVSFYAYLASLSICFMLGIYAIYRIVNDQLSWKFLSQAILICAGITLTVGLRRLYNKCSEEVKSLV